MSIATLAYWRPIPLGLADDANKQQSSVLGIQQNPRGKMIKNQSGVQFTIILPVLGVSENNNFPPNGTFEWGK